MLFRAAPSKPDFEREVMPHLRLLHGVALRMTRAEGDAEDLVQETVLRAYRFWDSFEAGTNCKAWLLRILTNAFRNRYREWEREQEILGEAESCDAHLGQFQGESPRDAESALFGRMLSRDVEKALGSLPAEFRLPVILADLEDLSYKEIADVMACPAGTVMSRLYRGRKLLQKRLYDYAVESGIIRAQGADMGTLKGFPSPPAMVRGEQSSPAPHATSEVAEKGEAQVVDLDGFRKMKQEGG
jgi:RNA polymerase sigma-70 factor (ECF subfamily)